MGRTHTRATVDCSTTLPAERASSGVARRFLNDVVGTGAQRDDTVDLDAALLCVTELVSNAVLHAESKCQVRVQRDGSRLRVEVFDNRPDLLPTQQPYDPFALTGRGLFLVETLTDAWGVDVANDGKTVWFELG